MILIHSALAFFALSMTVLSMWVKRSPWIWGPFLTLAFILGYMAKIVMPVALVPIGGLLIVHTILKGDIRGLARLALFGIATALSVGLIFGFFSGFVSWPILKNVILTKDAAPFSLYMNFNKPFIGIAVLATGFPLLSDFRGFIRAFKDSLPLILAGVIALIILAFFLDLVRFELKFPPVFLFFVVNNLIFVSIIEEAFWRGFFQKECYRSLGAKGPVANIGCILITALCFAGVHGFWISSFPFIFFVFISGIVYGMVYQYTKVLEISILTHWFFNVIHFTFFSYPMLKTSM